MIMDHIDEGILEGILEDILGRDGLSSLEMDMFHLLGDTPIAPNDPVIPEDVSSQGEMDAIAAVVHALQELVTTDVPSLEADLNDVMEIIALPDPPVTPPPPPPPHPPFTNYPQPVAESGGRGGRLHLGAAPVVHSIQAAPISQEDDISDVQRLISGMIRSTDDLLGYSFTPPPDRPELPPPLPPVSSPRQPPRHPRFNVISKAQSDSSAGVRFPDGVTQSFCPVGFLNGQMVNEVVPVASSPAPSAAPQLSTSTTKKRKRRNQHEDGRPYIRKPPNAFWLFSKEQRPILKEQFGYSPGVSVLGEMWRTMSSEEQDKYFQESYRLRRLHYQQHPDWVPNSSKKSRSD